MVSSLRAVLSVAVTVPVLAIMAAPPAVADPNSRPGTFAERPRDAAVHAVDGEVHSLAQVGSTIVFGGNFTRVGPVTRGAAGIVDTAASSFGESFPDVNGAVTVAIPDGTGGYFLGGNFTTVGVRRAATSPRSTPPVR